MSKTNIYMGMDLAINDCGISITLDGVEYFYYSISCTELKSLLQMIKTIFGESYLYICMEKVSGKWSRGKAACAIQNEAQRLIKSMWSRNNSISEINALTWRKKMYGNGKPDDAKQMALDYVNVNFGLKIENHNVAESIVLNKMCYDMHKE